MVAKAKDTYTITAENHDQGSPAVSFDRDGRERAEWSAKLLRECGYQTTTIEQHIEWTAS